MIVRLIIFLAPPTCLLTFFACAPTIFVRWLYYQPGVIPWIPLFVMSPFLIFSLLWCGLRMRVAKAMVQGTTKNQLAPGEAYRAAVEGKPQQHVVDLGSSSSSPGRAPHPYPADATSPSGPRRTAWGESELEATGGGP